MYAWYEAADVCYVYLFDVDDDDNPIHKDSQFRKSEWHSRAWTLQELLPSTNVVFLTKSWALIRHLSVLAPVLAEINGIDDTILLGGSDWRRQTSVAQRMSWAARRKAKRQEDRAYLLMGIFGVSMPIIYGEGLERAFVRPQKEVMNLCADQSTSHGARSTLNLTLLSTPSGLHRRSHSTRPIQIMPGLPTIGCWPRRRMTS